MNPPRRVPLTFLLPGWLRAPSVPIGWAKEIRAVFPAGVALVAALLLDALDRDYQLHGMLYLFAYGFGCPAIAAIAFGHDFTHRTLAMALSLPCPRERLWFAKMGATFVVLAPIGCFIAASVARWALPQPADMSVFAVAIARLSPIFVAFFVTPWLTLTLRHPLAGAVLSAALPLICVALSSFAVSLRFGEWEGDLFERGHFQAAVLTILSFSLWTTGYLLGRRKFMRLEALEGHSVEISLLSWRRKRSPGSAVRLAPRRSHPVVQLFKKELRLHGGSYLATGFFVVCLALSLAFYRGIREKEGAEHFSVAMQAFAWLISIMIGATASAEERQSRTLEWQALQPFPASGQWMIKAAVVMALSLCLGVILPAAALRAAAEVGAPVLLPAEFFAESAIFCVPLALFSLYISTLCNSPLIATLVSFFTAIWIGFGINYVRYGLAGSGITTEPGPGQGLDPARWGVFLSLVTGFFLILLRFARSNHRVDRPGAATIAWQLACLAAFAAIAPVAVMALLFVLAR